MTEPAPSFLWVTCLVGAEPFLRRELARDGTLRPAFARPGLITLKQVGGAPLRPDLPRPHPLVRSWGLSLGRANDAAEAAALLTQLGVSGLLHVIPGEAGPAGHVPPTVLQAWAEAAHDAERSIATSAGDRLAAGPARLGDRVADVIVRPGEPWLVGHHVHDSSRGPLPGGGYPLTPPPDAPSRAWAKLEELCAWSGAAPRAGDHVLEVGAAPGGATVALLDRGARVVAVDPRPYALPERLSSAPFEQKVAPIEALGRGDLPDDVDWLVVDMGVAAPVAVHVLERLVPRYRRRLRGVFATLKLNEWSLAGRLPGLLAQIRALGLSEVRAANLPSFRQEIGVFARP